MNCHKCTYLCKNYKGTTDSKTFLYRCIKTGKSSVITKDLNCCDYNEGYRSY